MKTRELVFSTMCISLSRIVMNDFNIILYYQNLLYFHPLNLLNKYISKKIKETFQNQNISIFFPSKEMMSDNAAMVAWNCLNKNIEAASDLYFKANPRLSINN